MFFVGYKNMALMQKNSENLLFRETGLVVAVLKPHSYRLKGGILGTLGSPPGSATAKQTITLILFDREALASASLNTRCFSRMFW